ncbi:hypothetical protein BAR24066_05788 [Burkholderia arboris]|uniref:Uncharacterized protein n=1 Tax=Burkholderia arboris TaxID=488730 RepID=A0A9Q9SNR9_9BURK|nr:hypothetical protein BAR24066_05788 [Burkholderia arboris]
MPDRHLLFEAGIHAQLHGEHGHRNGEQRDRREHERAMTEEKPFQATDQTIEHDVTPSCIPVAHATCHPATVRNSA